MRLNRAAHRALILVALALVAQAGGKPAVAADGPASTLFKPGDPGCENCGVGEYELRITDQMPAAAFAFKDEPACGNATAPIQQIGNAIITGAKAYAGDYDPKAIAATLTNAADALGVGGTVGSILHQWQPTYSACKMICGAVPEGAHLSGVNFLMTVLFHPKYPGALEEVKGGNEPPSPHQDYARIHTAQQSGRAVCSLVSNWADEPRDIVMKIYFTSDVKPLSGHP